MKKLIAYAMSAAMLCTLLCGCGSDQYGNGGAFTTTPSVAPQQDTTAVPTVSPMISPDVEDGIVTDRDGVIEDNNGSGSDRQSSGTNGTGTKGSGSAGSGMSGSGSAGSGMSGSGSTGS